MLIAEHVLSAAFSIALSAVVQTSFGTDATPVAALLHASAIGFESCVGRALAIVTHEAPPFVITSSVLVAPLLQAVFAPSVIFLTPSVHISAILLVTVLTRSGIPSLHGFCKSGLVGSFPHNSVRKSETFLGKGASFVFSASNPADADVAAASANSLS